MKKITFLILITAFFGCKKDETRQIDGTYKPVIQAADFTAGTNLTNSYMPFEPGKTYIFEGQTAEGKEHIELKRLAETKIIMGITCIVVNDKSWVNGVLIEDTLDWYAQDNTGTVWYFGEGVKNYNADGTFKDTKGSWTAGDDGAMPGIVMPANPATGLKYRQEYYFNNAEDEAEILETGLTVSVAQGTFQNCLKTHDFTALEPDLNENKFYAPGIGVIKEVNITDNETLELIDIQ
jgi:hypothetical protein